MPRTTAAVTLLLLALSGCSDAGSTAVERPTSAPTASAPTPEPLPTVMARGPLTDLVLGTWREKAREGADYLWSFSPAGSGDCVKVVKTSGSCYVIRTEGVPTPEDWGEAGQSGTVVTTLQKGGITASSQCIGKVSSYRFTLSGAEAAVEKGGCRETDGNYLAFGTLTREP